MVNVTENPPARPSKIHATDPCSRLRARWRLARLLTVLLAVPVATLSGAPRLHAQAPILPPSAVVLPGLSPSERPGGNEAAAKLAPIAAPAQPTPRDQLPLKKLKLPPGFHIEIYASGIAGARTVRVGRRGTVFVAGADKVSAIVNDDGRRRVQVVASGLTQPAGLAFHDGALFIAETSKISRIDDIESKLDAPPSPRVIYADLPNEQIHGARFLGIGPDGKLYVAIGLPCNNCVAPAGFGEIRRLAPDGTGVEVVARGVRNSLGFDWLPHSKQLYFTDNGRDWLSEDAPSDELNRLRKINEDFGAPYCYQGNLADPQFGWGRSCDEFTAPIFLLGPHTAPLGMRFYTGRRFPEDYRDAIFVARHGSWNRTRKIGGDVVALHLNKEGSVQSMEPFLTGFLQDNAYVGRPTDVQPMADGSLLISDDWNGAVYRVTYDRRR
jgi:glucose/arabinose dehydrogenase